MSWTMFIPNSMAYLGSICLGLAIILVLIDMPGGVNWSKVGAWAAILGGFGALGGAGGWIGHQIVSGRSTAMSFGERWGQQAIGVGAVVVVLLLGLAWAYSRVGKGGKGIDTKGSGKTGKAKSLIVCALFAIVGAALAGAIPELYHLTDWAVTSAGDGLRSLAA